VVNNVVALGGQVIVAGVVGEDSHGDILTREMESTGADITGLLRDLSRPTTSKMRVVAHSQQNSQQIIRIDRESREKISAELAAALLSRALDALPDVDAVLISDYNKGILVPALALPLIEACRSAGKPVAVDPKRPNIACLNGATLVQMNQHEAALCAQSMPDSYWEMGPPHDLNASETRDDVGKKLREFLGCDHLLMTQSAKGLTLFGPEGALHLPPIPAEVYDGTGVGDTVASVTTLTLAAGGSAAEAAVLGNAGGAIKVHKLGAVAVTREEMLLLLEEGKIEARGAA
jgi:D-beta-D-heptose 7-phosphate kinase/D-beta-D-heptose 1-phosphate adenosyltransferase